MTEINTSKKNYLNMTKTIMVADYIQNNVESLNGKNLQEIAQYLVDKLNFVVSPKNVYSVLSSMNDSKIKIPDVKSTRTFVPNKSNKVRLKELEERISVLEELYDEEHPNSLRKDNGGSYRESRVNW